VIFFAAGLAADVSSSIADARFEDFPTGPPELMK